MELWWVERGEAPRKVRIDLELGGDACRDADGRSVRPETHFATEEEAWAIARRAPALEASDLTGQRQAV
jgi:hypothetical protein